MMSTFRKGDKVSVQGTVAYDHDGTLVHLFIDMPDGAQIIVKPDSVSLVSQRFEAGDVVDVKLATRIAAAMVLAVSEEHGMAWLDLGPDGTAQQPLATLTRSEQPRDIAEAA